MQIFRDKSTPDAIKLDLLINQDLIELVYPVIFTQPDSAISYGKTIYNFVEIKDLKASMVRANLTIGSGNYYKGDMLNALDYYLKALKIAEQLNDTVKRKNKLLTFTYNNLGNVYSVEEKYNMALNYYFKSKEIIDYYFKSKEEPKEEWASLSLFDFFNNTGINYQDEKKYDQAEIQLLKALSISNEIATSEITIAMSNLGALYFEMGNINKSIRFFEESLSFKGVEIRITEEINSLNGLGESYLWQADSIYKTTHKIDHTIITKALSFSKQALTLAEKEGFLRQIEISSENLYKTYKILGDTEKSLAMHEIFVASKDSLNTIDAEEEIQRLKYEDEYQKEKLKSQLALKEKAFKRNVLLAIVLGVFIALIIYMFLKSKKNKKIEKQLIHEIDMLKSHAVLLHPNDLKTGEAPKLNKEKIEQFIGNPLNPTDWKIINHLYENPSVTAKELSIKISLSKQGIYSSLKKMYRQFDLHQKNENQRLALVIKSLEISGFVYLNN